MRLKNLAPFLISLGVALGGCAKHDDSGCAVHKIVSIDSQNGKTINSVRLDDGGTYRLKERDLLYVDEYWSVNTEFGVCEVQNAVDKSKSIVIHNESHKPFRDIVVEPEKR